MNLHKSLKPNEIFSKKKKQTIFWTCDNLSLFGKFPTLCNYIFIFKLIYSLPSCLLTPSRARNCEQKFPQNFSCQILKSFLASFLAQTKQNFLSVSYLVSNGHSVLFLHKLVLHSILRPISANTIRIYSTGKKQK